MQKRCYPKKMSFIKNASLALNANVHSIQHYAMTLQMAKYFAGTQYWLEWETYVLKGYIMQTFVKIFSLFYRLCYGKNFGPKGYGFGGAGSVPALMSGDLGQFAEDRVP